MADFILPDDNDEVGVLLNAFGNPVAHQDVQAMFESIDANGDQRITKKELNNFFGDNQIEDNSYTEVFEALDEKGNKMVSFDDFETYVANIPTGHFKTWEALFSMSHLEFEPTDADYNIDYVAACKTRTRDWQGRIEAMEAFCRIILETAGDEKSFQKKFRPMKEPLLTQLGDRRSVPVRACCAILAKLALNRRNWLYKYSKRVLTVLFEVVRLNVEIMSESGHQCCEAWVRSMDDRKCEIINYLATLVRSKYDKVKIRATEYVIIQIQKTDPDNKRYKKWWEACMGMLKDCTTNSTAAVRSNALKALALIHAMKKKEVDKITKKLNSAMKKKWKKILEETYTDTKPKKRQKSQRIPTSVNIKRQMVQAGIIDADPNDPDVADLIDVTTEGSEFDGIDDSSSGYSVPSASAKRTLKAPAQRVRRKSTNKSREIVELEMELQRVYSEVTGLRQQSATLKATQITVQRLTTANDELRRENEEVRAHAEEMNITLSGVQDILDQFDEMQVECDTLHRELAAKNASMETAINMIQNKEMEIEDLTRENVELADMCQQLLGMLEEQGNVDVDMSSLSPRTRKIMEIQKSDSFAEPSPQPPSKHAALREEMMRRISKTISSTKVNSGDAPLTTKQAILAKVHTETKSRILLNQKSESSVGGEATPGELRGIGEDEEMVQSPSLGGINSIDFEKVRSPSRGAFDPDSLDLDPETLLAPPDQEMLTSLKGRGHRRRDTATHRKRITRGQSFFKKLLEKEKEERDDIDTVWG